MILAQIGNWIYSASIYSILSLRLEIIEKWLFLLFQDRKWTLWLSCCSHRSQFGRRHDKCPDQVNHVKKLSPGITAYSPGINLTRPPWEHSSYYTPSSADNQSLHGSGQEDPTASQCLTKDRPFWLNTSIRDTRLDQCITSLCNPDNSIRLANYKT